MSGAWDDRKKGLEEDYFRRKEQEAIEKMRAKKQQEAEEQKVQSAMLQCPRCDGKLKEISYEDVLVDRCEKCHGVWLDAGELERLTEGEGQGGWLGRMWKSVSGN